MDDFIDLTAEDFPEVKGARTPNQTESDFKSDFEILVNKYKIINHLVSVAFDKENATLIVEACDDFIHVHIQMCHKALEAPGKVTKVN